MTLFTPKTALALGAFWLAALPALAAEQD